ncbi:long-chain fatty acid--CoA ligase [Jatrophihabitans telluris]|uniref:Acyl-CoA synthetase n=1 Tax=Jatrophihabitans telluris TaxID=2038343 RepID=A0ABY4QVA0_9ACTN|nr:long-chain fatty acid--CoA ligase [Jatrophihabitans telluris]UQX87239.1 long-chain fatty acid--CoA ligase [Jatrophihabitans telluris]
MRELTIPSAGTAKENSAARYVYERAASSPDNVAIRVRQGSGWADVTSAELAEQVGGIARGLLASGIDTGDRVALMSKTRYEWTLFDFAILSLGAVVVPIYETSSAEQVQWILADSEAKAVVVENEAHAAIVAEVREQTPDLQHVWQIDSGAVQSLIGAGAEIDIAEVHKRLDATQPSDLASLIYTSGTTGRPKGCELTHANFLAEVFEIVSGLDHLFNAESSTLLFLPIAHVFGRVIEIGAIATGTTLGHTADIRNLVADLGVFKPRFVLSVPRVFEKVYNTAKQRAHSEGKGPIFDRAERVAIAYSEALDGRGPGLGLKLQHTLFDKLVYGKLRAALGGRCESAISGGAPLGARLGHFFRGIGVTIFEGYGLTETTAGIFLNVPDKVKVGSVGRPVGGTSVRIAEDGEVLLSGPVVFAGYWRNPAATAEAIEEIDGKRWFHSGDIGVIDNDGFLTITGRKKELIVTAGGKNVAPAVLEDRVRAHWLVSQCLVVGDQQPFIAALITVDPESFPAWLKQAGKPEDAAMADMVDDPDLHAELQKAVDDANKAVSKAEAIKKFTVLPEDWTEATGQLTPSLKLKRNLVLSECKDEIASLYSGDSRS